LIGDFIVTFRLWPARLVLTDLVRLIRCWLTVWRYFVIVALFVFFARLAFMAWFVVCAFLIWRLESDSSCAIHC